MERSINLCPGVGASAHIIQHSELLFPALYFEHTHLFLIQQGQTRIRCGLQEIVARAGELLIVEDGLTADVINSPSDSGMYSCLMLICDPLLFDTLSCAPIALPPIPFSGITALPNLPGYFLHSLEIAALALAPHDRFPPAIARHKMCEILLWLAHLGIRFMHQEVNDLAQRVRSCLASDPHWFWTAAEVAESLMMSEVMLRRKLSAENTALRSLMIDVRMSRALLLLQATDWPISVIAQYVGYESASRFAERFRKRFGFAPTAIRGHQRIMQPTAAPAGTWLNTVEE
jgi:AraC-like DNA-binding protein